MYRIQQSGDKLFSGHHAAGGRGFEQAAQEAESKGWSGSGHVRLELITCRMNALSLSLDLYGAKRGRDGEGAVNRAIRSRMLRRFQDGRRRAVGQRLVGR